MNHLLNEWMNGDGVCRTAPAVKYLIWQHNKYFKLFVYLISSHDIGSKFTILHCIEACPNTWLPKTLTWVQLHPKITELCLAIGSYCLGPKYRQARFFSPNRPTGPSRSSSRDVRPWVVCCVRVVPFPCNFFIMDRVRIFCVNQVRLLVRIGGFE